MSVVGLIAARVAMTLSSALDLGTAACKQVLDFTAELASGTGDSQVDRLFSDERTITASSSENLDLAGSLADALGATITMVELAGLIVTADATNTNNVVLGNGTNPLIGGPFGAAGANTIAIPPGGVFQWFAPKDGQGVAVTASTGDILKVANSGAGTSVKYKIVLFGRSA